MGESRSLFQEQLPEGQMIHSVKADFSDKAHMSTAALLLLCCSALFNLFTVIDLSYSLPLDPAVADRPTVDADHRVFSRSIMCRSFTLFSQYASATITAGASHLIN